MTARAHQAPGTRRGPQEPRGQAPLPEGSAGGARRLPVSGDRGPDLIVIELRPVMWSGLQVRRTFVESAEEATFVDSPCIARDRWFPDAILPNEWQDTLPWELADRVRLGWRRGRPPE